MRLQHSFWQKGEEQFIRCHEGNRVHYKDGIGELKCGKYGGSYLWANCTKPHCFPTGIFTEEISPYWEKVCLRSSSLTFGSSPPTNTYAYSKYFD